MKKHTQHQLERKIQETTNEIVHKEYGNYMIERNQIVKERDKKVAEAQEAGASMQEISHINEKCHEQCEQIHEKMVKNIDKTAS